MTGANVFIVASKFKRISAAHLLTIGLMTPRSSQRAEIAAMMPTSQPMLRYSLRKNLFHYIELGNKEKAPL